MPVRQTLGLGKFATQERPHCMGTGVKVDTMATFILFEPFAVAHQHVVEGRPITHFEGGGDRVSERFFDQVGVAYLLGGCERLVQRSADIRKLRRGIRMPCTRGSLADQGVAKRSTIAKAPGHVAGGARQLASALDLTEVEQCPTEPAQNAAALNSFVWAQGVKGRFQQLDGRTFGAGMQLHLFGT
jgi:hypothetical protein